MKKLLVLALALGSLASCEDIQIQPTTQRVGEGSIQVINFEGHEYLSYDGDDYNGGFCHSESCPCKSK